MPMTVARAIIGHTFCVQHRAAAAGSSIGPIASNVPKAWKLATRLRTTSVMKMARKTLRRHPHRAQERRVEGFDRQRAIKRRDGEQRHAGDAGNKQQRVHVDRKHRTEKNMHQIRLASPRGDNHNPERQRHKIEGDQADVLALRLRPCHERGQSRPQQGRSADPPKLRAAKE